MRENLLKLADVVAPNIDEAAALSGLAVRVIAEVPAAALRLHKLGARNVIITGGHLDPPTDFLSIDSGAWTKTFTGKKISTRSTHGTGCAFSTGLACSLAAGSDLVQAMTAARAYVRAALQSASPLGKGTGPVV
jgi:hydroxymethylpyrimidine kinase/phosphomethylpyrimidine kinase